MKRAILFLFLTSGCAYAQVPVVVSRRDSIPSDVPMGRMPNSRPGNSFYRDRQPLLRATQDNMPVIVPDTSTYYTMKVHGTQRQKPHLPPLPKIIPPNTTKP